MKSIIRPWLLLAGLVIVPWVIGFALWRPWLLLAQMIPLVIIAARSKSVKWAVLTPPARKIYRLRNPDAGRWLEAPVAELDKSTIGKLLASRASRDPGVHVVVRSTQLPPCTDALYDPEIDG